jgi:hypothetical protein
MTDLFNPPLHVFIDDQRIRDGLKTGAPCSALNDFCGYSAELGTRDDAIDRLLAALHGLQDQVDYLNQRVLLLDQIRVENEQLKQELEESKRARRPMRVVEP